MVKDNTEYDKPSMATSAGTTKPEAKALGVDAEKRWNLQVYETLVKEAAEAKTRNPEGYPTLVKMRDEAREKAGLPDPEAPKKK